MLDAGESAARKDARAAFWSYLVTTRGKGFHQGKHLTLVDKAGGEVATLVALTGGHKGAVTGITTDPELMDPKDAKKVVEEAKKQGKTYLVLHRHIGEWDKAFRTREAGDRKISPPASVTSIRAAFDKAKLPIVPVHGAAVEDVGAEAIPEEKEEASVEYKQFLEMYEEENKALQEEVRQLKVDLSTANDLSSALDTQVTSLSKKAEQMEGNWRDTQGSLEEVMRKLGDASKEVVRLKALPTPPSITSPATSRQLADFQTRISTLEGEVQAAKESAAAYKAETTKLKNRLEAKEAELKTAIRARGHIVEELEGRIGLAQTEIARLGSIVDAKAEVDVVGVLTKDVLFAWSNLVSDARSGAKGAFQELLKVSHKVGITMEELLKQLEEK